MSSGLSLSNDGRSRLHWVQVSTGTELLSLDIFLNVMSWRRLSPSNHPLLALKSAIFSFVANSWAFAFNHERSAYGEAAPSAKSLCAHFDPVRISLFPHLTRW